MLDPEFVLDTAARARLLDRFGPDAEPWCDGLAGLVAACCQRWGLELDEARELTVGTVDYGLVHGDLHLFNVLDGGLARKLVAIDPRSSRGDRTWDAIDIALARASSADELDDRISRIAALVPGLDAGRLRQWCQATAVIGVVQRLFGGRHDGAVPDKFLLDLAAGRLFRGRPAG
jgi:hypothetical protein